MPYQPPFVVAIDGPAASGKGTIGRAVAYQFGFRYLDTGLLYRSVAAELLRNGLVDFSSDQALAIARGISEPVQNLLHLRSVEVTRVAPLVAAIPEVRAALVDFQRAFARRPGGAVLDGRDIGTVICPEAEVKLFVTASDTIRANRRWLELGGDEAEVLAQVRERDARDAGRDTAPMVAAADAVVLDTSAMPVEEAVARAVAIVGAALARTG